jgi:hypothetical protein
MMFGLSGTLDATAVAAATMTRRSAPIFVSLVPEFGGPMQVAMLRGKIP